MDNLTQKISQEALTLPESERANLAVELLDSLDPACDEDAELLWQQEVSRRVAELHAGMINTVPWTVIRERLFPRSNG